MSPTTDDLQSLVLLVLVGSHVLLWLRVRAQAPTRTPASDQLCSCLTCRRVRAD